MSFNQRKWALTILTGAVCFATACWWFAGCRTIFGGALDHLVPK